MKTANIPVYGTIALYIKYCALSKNRLYTNILLQLFSIFTIKMPQAIGALASVGLFIVKTLTNLL